MLLSRRAGYLAIIAGTVAAPAAPALPLVNPVFPAFALSPASAATPVPLPSTVTGLSIEQIEIVSWALALFADAELALPPIDFVGHDATGPCFDRAAAHTHASGRSRIDICTTMGRPVAEFLVLHEIAHAWDRRSLTADTRAAFLELRDLTEWRNDDPARWHHRGAEHAAEIIMWGLMDRPVQVVRVAAASCAQLLAGYRLLTGAEPLHGFTQRC